MRQFLIILFLTCTLFARNITPSHVYSLAMLTQEHLHFLLKHYEIKHEHDAILERNTIRTTGLLPRHPWQKTYEILVKINRQRVLHGFTKVAPVGIEPQMYLKPLSVYEMNMRILTELRILEDINEIKVPDFKHKIYKNKLPLDVYNVLVDNSAALDELNKSALTPSYVFSETMRIYDDISIILNYLKISDSSIPNQVMVGAKPKDALNTAFELIEEIQRLQKSMNFKTVGFIELKKDNTRPSDVFSITGIILAELQTIKAYIGASGNITPPALVYNNKKPENVEQLMRWNLKRLKLIEKLSKGN